MVAKVKTPTPHSIWLSALFWSFDDAYNQLTTGAGNLVGQTDKLSKLGARHAKQLEAGLVEKALDETLERDGHLKLFKEEAP